MNGKISGIGKIITVGGCSVLFGGFGMLSPSSVGLANAGGVDEGLVAHYSFNGNSTDTAGNNNGILVGNAAFTNGINGQSLRLSEEGDYVRIPAKANINLNVDSKTISVWFKAGKQKHSQVSIIDKTSTSDYSLMVSTNLNSSVLRLELRAYDGSKFQEIDCFVPSAEWINAVLLKSGASLSLYTNSHLAGTMSIPSVLTKNNSLIVGAGGSPYNSGYGFTGLIQDLRFYDRALTVGEIQGLYVWSFPRLSISNGSSHDEFQISWSAIIGKTYQLQTCTNLDSAIWIFVGMPTLATNGMMTIKSAKAAPLLEQFYRVIVWQ